MFSSWRVCELSSMGAAGSLRAANMIRCPPFCQKFPDPSIGSTPLDAIADVDMELADLVLLVELEDREPLSLLFERLECLEPYLNPPL